MLLCLLFVCVLFVYFNHAFIVIVHRAVKLVSKSIKN
jgi:hypothetical protein